MALRSVYYLQDLVLLRFGLDIRCAESEIKGYSDDEKIQIL